LPLKHEREVVSMKKKLAVLATEDDLLVDLTFHNVPASLLTEFAEKIVMPYYQGNINAAIQDLIHKALAEQDFVLSHITHVRSRSIERLTTALSKIQSEVIKHG
jgi:hypothetical protein